MKDVKTRIANWLTLKLAYTRLAKTGLWRWAYHWSDARAYLPPDYFDR